MVHRTLVGRCIGSLSRYGSDSRCPTVEGEGILRGCLFSRLVARRRFAKVPQLGLNHCTILVLEGHGILVHRTLVGRCIGSIACHGYDSRSPTVKGVCVLRGCLLGRLVARRRFAKVPQLGLYDCTILVLEGYGVLVHRTLVGRRIGSIACHGRDSRGPTVEGEGILRGCLLGRVFARRRFAKVPQLGLNHRFIFVLEGYGILVHRTRVGRGIGCITRDGSDSRSPTVEGIRILRGCLLGRVFARRRCTKVERLGLKGRTVLVLEGNGILVHRTRVGSGIGRIACDIHHSRRPTVEGVCILCRSILGRGCTAIGRRLAVVPLFGLKHGTIFVLKGDGVRIQRALIGSGIGSIACHSYQRRRPADIVVAGLLIRRLDRCLTRVNRCLAIRHLDGLEQGVIIVIKCNSIYISYTIIVCHIDRIGLHGSDSRSPSLEGIGVLCRSRSGRLAARRSLTIVPLFGLNDYAIIVSKGDGILVLRALVGSRIGDIAYHRNHRAVPTIKGVAILIRTLFGRRSAGWCSAVVPERRLDNCAVIVFEGDGILVDDALIACRIGSLADDSYDLRTPTCESKGILICSCFGRGIARRRSTIVECLALEGRTVLVLKGDGVLIYRACIGSGIDSISRNGFNRRAPTLEGIGIVCIGRSGRCISIICRCCSFFHFA